jgi:hypothetical protein
MIFFQVQRHIRPFRQYFKDTISIANPDPRSIQSPEMEAIDIIFAKKNYRFCQLSSHSRGFFARV